MLAVTQIVLPLFAVLPTAESSAEAVLTLTSQVTAALALPGRISAAMASAMTMPIIPTLVRDALECVGAIGTSGGRASQTRARVVLPKRSMVRGFSSREGCRESTRGVGSAPGPRWLGKPPRNTSTPWGERWGG